MISLLVSDLLEELLCDADCPLAVQLIALGGGVDVSHFDDHLHH